MNNFFLSAILSLLFVFPTLASADGTTMNSDAAALFGEKAPATASATVAPGSDAQFDKRLPPVLPGEVVNDSGKKTKVWSTSGPVPVAEAPEPWKERRRNHALEVTEDGQGNIGVIVDRRD